MFERQLQIAVELNKPIVIHCRDAEADCIEIVSRVNALIYICAPVSPSMTSSAVFSCVCRISAFRVLYVCRIRWYLGPLVSIVIASRARGQSVKRGSIVFQTASLV